MNASAASAVLRRRLSAFELNVLTLGGRGGADLIVRDLSGVKSIEDAQEALETVKAKAERFVQEEAAQEEREAERDVERERAAAQRRERRELAQAVVARGLRDAPAPSRDPVVPAEQVGTEANDGDGGRRASIDDTPPILPPSPTTDFDKEPASPFEPPPPATMPHRGPGELRAMALAYIAEHGPVRQADVRTHLAIGSPQMAGLVRVLEPRLLIGEPVGRSPMLSIRPDDEVKDAGNPRVDDGVPVADEARHEADDDASGAASDGGDGRGPEQAAPERDEEAAAPPAVEARGDDELHYVYVMQLLQRAKDRDCPEHIFDRIERALIEGPPSWRR